MCQYPDAPAGVDRAIQALVSAGAAIAVEPGGPGILVGLIRHLGGDRWFWWAAGCEDEFGGHVVEGAPRIWHGGLGIEWDTRDHKGGRYAYLTTIEEAKYDPSAQARDRATLASWRRLYSGSERLRSFIDRQAQQRIQPDPLP